MATQKRTPGDRRLLGNSDLLRLYSAFALALAFVAATAFIWIPRWREREYRLTITAGNEEGLRHSIAQLLAGLVRQQGVVLDVAPTSGSVDALHLVNSGKLDLALAQGGLPTSGYPNVREVAVLHIEPLHLLVKSDALGAAPDHLTLEDLCDRLKKATRPKVNVSTDGSGTSAISSELLSYFGLRSGVDYEATHLSYSELMDSQRSCDNLPDAVFTVSSLPSPVAEYLITRRGFRPVELAVADAFRIDWSPEQRSAGSPQGIVRRRIVETLIPAYTYQVNPPVPQQALRTLGTRLHLVAHRNAPAEAVERVIAAIYNSSFVAAANPPLSVSLLQTAPEFELHAGAATYLERKTPIITEHVIELTEQVLAILGTVCGAGFFLWQGLSFLRRRRRDRQFLACLERLTEIERRSLQFERDEQMTVDDLVQLEEELQQIKAGMIHRFQSGDIEGADTLSAFLTHVNNAHENLTRMILHERSPRPA